MVMTIKLIVGLSCNGGKSSAVYFDAASLLLFTVSEGNES